MGNHQVRFLGEGVAVMPPPYPTRNQSGFSRRTKKKPRTRSGLSKRSGDYAAFIFGLAVFFAGVILTGGFFSALAFSFAANSCLTLRAMASVSTLYTAAASFST